MGDNKWTINVLLILTILGMGATGVLLFLIGNVLHTNELLVLNNY